MKTPLQENRTLFFYSTIQREPIEVKLDVGWIWITKTTFRPKWWNPFRKIKVTETWTTEEVRCLIKAFEELLPNQEEEHALKSCGQNK